MAIGGTFPTIKFDFPQATEPQLPPPTPPFLRPPGNWNKRPHPFLPSVRRGPEHPLFSRRKKAEKYAANGHCFRRRRRTESKMPENKDSKTSSVVEASDGRAQNNEQEATHVIQGEGVQGQGWSILTPVTEGVSRECAGGGSAEGSKDSYKDGWLIVNGPGVQQ